MGYDHRTAPDTVDAVSGAAPRTAPGKRTATERLPASVESTGVPVVDAGTACERQPSADKVCFLTVDQRTRYLDAIGNRAGIVGANARDALQDTHIEVLLEQPDGWGALAEFFFYSTTGPIIGMIMKSVKASRFAGAADDIQATLVNVSRAQRKVLQGMVSVAPGKASKARFIQLVRDSIGPWQQELTEVKPTELDDAGLTALKDSLDASAMTVDYFKGRITDMLSRFDKQQIDQVGVTAIYRQGELMWLGKGRDRRLVILEDKGLHHLTGSGDDTKPRDLVQKVGRDGKPIVIDQDLEPMALTFYRERTGRDPFEMDVETAIAKGGALAAAASEMVLKIATLGGAM